MTFWPHDGIQNVVIAVQYEVNLFYQLGYWPLDRGMVLVFAFQATEFFIGPAHELFGALLALFLHNEKVINRFYRLLTVSYPL